MTKNATAATHNNNAPTQPTMVPMSSAEPPPSDGVGASVRKLDGRKPIGFSTIKTKKQTIKIIFFKKKKTN